ncbi:hypothetical protein ATN84_08645 [Paramesorhizobium deserti]|uniref:Uncharacterized protein n=1 Tax=Paramesorhizobium deserti TaxID=1494590 RepID=A0A135HWA1_9HYPH|nr:hypothetical protein ATN84_08645 [Paramesorhizobium deserti]
MALVGLSGMGYSKNLAGLDRIEVWLRTSGDCLLRNHPKGQMFLKNACPWRLGREKMRRRGEGLVMRSASEGAMAEIAWRA